MSGDVSGVGLFNSSVSALSISPIFSCCFERAPVRVRQWLVCPLELDGEILEIHSC